MLRYAVVTAALTIAVIGGTRVLFASVLDQRYTKDKVLAGMHLLHASEPAIVHSAPASPAPATADGTSQLEAIRARGSLRVGFLPDALPFAFFNEQQELVGFDVELAHRLANELGVRLELVAVAARTARRRRRSGLLRHRHVGRCGDHRLAPAVRCCRSSYLDETLGFVVPRRRA